MGDQIVIDVFLDAPGPLTLLSIALLSTADTLDYCGACSSALPIVHPTSTFGSTGAQPGYILYSPAAGMVQATILYPQQTPHWLNFPPPAGFEQVDVNYSEAAFNATVTTGNNIWIASLVYDISGSGTIDLEIPSTGCFLVPEFCTPDFTSEGAPIVVNVPEPTTALLVGFSLLALGLVRSVKR